MRTLTITPQRIKIVLIMNIVLQLNIFINTTYVLIELNLNSTFEV